MAITARTGHPCQVSGIYRADCGDCANHPERAIPKGHLVPPCVGCSRAVTWTLVRAADTDPKG